ncbi:MAG: hypothetical protein E7224_06725 [Clostridiales bacterium]|nr:hypothetical protein [Clostridiales bacterium]
MQENTRIRGPLFDEEGRMAIIDGMRYYKKTQDQNNMVRFFVELDEPVDPECLAYGAKKAFARIRILRMVVVSDGKCFYLKENHAEPAIHKNIPGRYTVGGEENNGYLTRIGYRENIITIDFFHGMSDGIGVIAFSRTLLHYYFLMKNGSALESTPGTLLMDTPESPEEYADCQLFVPDEEAVPQGQYVYERAFQLPEDREGPAHASKFYLLKADAAAFEEAMRRNGSSRSAMLAMLMNRAVVQCHPIGNEPVVAALAANARGAYGAEKTLQCCVSTIPVWYDRELDTLPAEEQFRTAKEMVRTGVKPENMIAAAQRNRKFNEALEARFSTLAEKQEFAKMVNKQGGVKYTYGISYIGEVDYGPGIREHVKAAYAVLCANTIPVIMEAAKCGDQYYICYCTQLKADPYVLKLIEQFQKQGIPCTCEQREDFEETLALF